MARNSITASDTADKREHRVFHPDEERELDARLAELSGSDVELPIWAGDDRGAPSSAERFALAFGTFGSI